MKEAKDLLRIARAGAGGACVSSYSYFFQTITLRVARKETVVMLSARELSMGITKLSGSNPLRYVNMATANAIIIIMETARMLVVTS